jgi:hypothetical protein
VENAPMTSISLITPNLAALQFILEMTIAAHLDMIAVNSNFIFFFNFRSHWILFENSTVLMLQALELCRKKTSATTMEKNMQLGKHCPRKKLQLVKGDVDVDKIFMISKWLEIFLVY